MYCENCGKPIPPIRIKRRAKLCSTQCYRERSKKRYKRLNPRTGLVSGTVGAMNELLVAADLLRRGFSVFRAMSQACSCDLAVLKGRTLLRVEVTTGTLTPGGKISYAPHDRENFDIMAVVLGDK